MVVAEVEAVAVAFADEAAVVVESLEDEVDAAGAEVIEDEPEEAVAVAVPEEAAVDAFLVAEAPAAQVAVVGRAPAFPTEPQMAFANWMVAIVAA